MNRPLLGLAAVLAIAAVSQAVCPSRLQAQDPADRVAIEQLRDSLAQVSDSAALHRVERALIERARQDRDNPLLHLRLGFIALRLGDLGDKPHYEDAASEFTWASELRPDWPYPWYGLGLAELAIGEPELAIVAGLQRMFGRDHLTKGALAFARAAEVDPSFVKGLVELASTAMSQRINIKLDLALQALRAASATAAARNPEVLLWRGRVERESGDIDSSIVQLRRYVQSGNNRGLGLLELARSMFVKGDLAGARPYFEGAASDDSASVAEYRADLALIAPDSILTRFDASEGSERAALLRGFWADRDRLELRRDNERLREHYRRIDYARHNFMLVSTNRHYDIIERYKSGSEDFDDRGIIYIRHGAPSDRASLTIPGIEFNETWKYVSSGADPDMVFHFVAREDVQDYKLVESLYDVLGFSGALQARIGNERAQDNAMVEQLLQSRENISPIYTRLQGSGTAGLVSLTATERSMGQRSISRGTTTDSYRLIFDQPMNVRTDVMAVGESPRGSLLHVTWAIPGAALQPENNPLGLVYTVRLRVTVTDSLGRPVASLDTLKRFLSRVPVPAGENLVDHVALAVPPGTLHYRVAIQQSDQVGTVLPPATLQVGRFDGSRFAVSSVVLGWRGANLRWVRPRADTVFFNPTGTFRQNGDMDLYYEVYGLPRGTTYQVELLVGRKGGGTGDKIFAGGRPALTLGFEERADSSVTHSRRSIVLDRLKPGAYILKLVIHEPDGAIAERLSEFQVAPPDETARR
ncbi:MAG: GWxTD domain-containing protein [Gemmatimonadales bacterium]